MVRIKASDPDYPAIALSMHLLGVLLNPGCWHGYDNRSALDWIGLESKLKHELRDIFDDVNFKELTHE